MTGAPITRIDARAYSVPTDEPEADGTFAWERTTIVVVELHAGGSAGLGYTYASAAAAAIVNGVLASSFPIQANACS